MCLIVLAWQQHPTTPLLLAANRDEFHARATDPAGFWPDHPQLLAGKDLEAGGTWLGVTRSGRFAALTNVRAAPSSTAEAKRSRGELTLNFLTSDADCLDYLGDVAGRREDYLGFNLLVSDGQTLCCLHSGPEQEATPITLAPGVYGLSNAALDTPWPKVCDAKDRLEHGLLTGGDELLSHDALEQCLNSRHMEAEADTSAPGVDPELLRRLSAQFIVTPRYGTRCCTTLRWHSNQHWDFRERRFDAQGDTSGCDYYEHRPQT